MLVLRLAMMPAVMGSDVLVRSAAAPICNKGDPFFTTVVVLFFTSYDTSKPVEILADWFLI